MADTYSHRIQKFTPSGTFVTRWGSRGTEPGQFDTPYGLAVDSDDHLFVVDYNNHRLQVFSRDGDFVTQWGSYGTGTGQFKWPFGVAIDSSDNVYVTDAGNQRIQKFTKSGTFLAARGNPGTGPSQFNGPQGVAVDSAGNVFVIDHGNNRVQKFASDGTYVAQWGSWGDASGQFRGPRGVAVDGLGNVYVAEEFNHRIQKFTSEGTFLATWGGQGWGDYGSAAGELAYPYGLTLDRTGRAYVADTGNSRIQVFREGHPAPDSHSGLVFDGSFETDLSLSEWAFGGDLPVERATAGAQQGTYAARLGSAVPATAQGESEAWLAQTIYVDPAYSQPTLSFTYEAYVNDALSSADFFVEIQDGVGRSHLSSVIQDGYSGDGLPPPSFELGTRTHTYDLSAFSGESIRLEFRSRNLWTDSRGIWAFVDNVQVLDGSVSTPAPNPVPSPVPSAVPSPIPTPARQFLFLPAINANPGNASR